MGVAQLLEEFGREPVPQAPAAPLGSEEIEDLKLKAFEDGYGAGWEDALAAQEQSGKLLSETLKNSLMDLSMTREEILTAYIQATERLFSEITNSLLPEIADQTLVDHVIAELTCIARDVSDLPIKVVVRPDDHENVSKRVEGLTEVGVSISTDSNLQSGQACLLFGESEKGVDLSSVIQEIKSIIESFHSSIQKGSTDV